MMQTIVMLCWSLAIGYNPSLRISPDSSQLWILDEDNYTLKVYNVNLTNNPAAYFTMHPPKSISNTIDSIVCGEKCS